MESVGPDGKVRLKGKISQTYLCFNQKGRLVTEVSSIALGYI